MQLLARSAPDDAPGHTGSDGLGEVGFVSPFRYLNLLWAMILGWAVFGDLPGPITLLGAGLIVLRWKVRGQIVWVLGILLGYWIGADHGEG